MPLLSPTASARPAAFFDRDGTLNHLVDRGTEFRIRGEAVCHTAPFERKEIRLISGAREAVDLARRAGYLIVLVTNQPDVANGFISEDEFEHMRRIFQNWFAFDGMQICMHLPNNGCACRKPSPKMLHDAARELNIDLARSYMIGDMESDVLAGLSAGAQSIRLTDDATCITRATHRVSNLHAAVALLPRL